MYVKLQGQSLCLWLCNYCILSKLLSVINSACQLLCAIIKIILSLPTAFAFFENHLRVQYKVPIIICEWWIITTQRVSVFTGLDRTTGLMNNVIS